MIIYHLMQSSIDLSDLLWVLGIAGMILGALMEWRHTRAMRGENLQLYLAVSNMQTHVGGLLSRTERLESILMGNSGPVVEFVADDDE